MKRHIVAIAVGALLAASAGAAQPSSAASPAALRVNGTDAVGRVGDEVLSLAEAIRLANGSLTTGELSGAERSRVKGKPGARSHDLITITLGKGAVIDSQQAALNTSYLPRIENNTGDTLDGGDAVLRGQGPASGTGLFVSSSDFTLKNLAIAGFVQCLAVDFGGGRDLKNVTISRLRATDNTFGAIDVGAKTGSGRLRGVRITDSLFDSGDAVAGTVNLAGSSFTGGITNNTVLEDVLFARNEVVGGLEGFYVYGGVNNAGHADHAYVRNVQVLDNYFHDSTDAAMNLDGGSGIVNDVTDVGIEGVVMAGNRIVATNWGIGVWGGEAFGGGSVRHAHVRRVDIHDNSISGVPGSPTKCVVLEAGRVDVAGVTTDATISDVRIRKNHMSGCGTSGIELNGAVALVGGTVADSHITKVVIEHNTVTKTPVGLLLRGALSTVGSLSTSSSVSGVTFQHNRLIEAVVGMRFVGGEVDAAGALATGNALTSVVLRANTVRSGTTACVAQSDAGPGAAGNSITARCS